MARWLALTALAVGVLAVGWRVLWRAPRVRASPAQLLDFALLCGRLKSLKRAGWVRTHVQDPESVADHMYRMSLLALAADAEGLDSARCVKMALVHDLGEAIVGDITPHDNVSKEDKETRERAAFEEIEQLLGRSSVAREMRQLWEEYEAGASAEARLVKDADRMDMIVQAFEYERAQGLSLEDFFASTRGGFTHPAMVALDAELRARRAAMLAERAGEASRASAAK